MLNGDHSQVGGHASCNDSALSTDVNLSPRAETTPTESPAPRVSSGDTSGLVLLVLKHFLMCRCQPGTLELLARKVSPEHARALLDPDPSGSYPSAHLNAIARALKVYLTDGHPESFAGLVYEIALFGFRHGFRHAIELGDTRRVLDSVPDLWRRLEPAHPQLQVAHETHRSVLTIPPGPESSNELREQVTVGVLSALLFAATGQVPVVSVCHDELGGLELSIERLYC